MLNVLTDIITQLMAAIGINFLTKVIYQLECLK